MIQRMFVTIDTKKTNYKNVGKINHGDDLILELTVLSDGDMISFNNPMVDLLVKKSDGKMIRQNSGIEHIKPNKFIIEVSKDCVTSPGLSTNQLIINDNGRISTCMFYYTILSSLEEDIIESVSNVEVLEQLDEFTIQMKDKMENFDNELQNRMSELKNDIDDLVESFGATSVELQEAELSRNEAEQTRAQAESVRVQNESRRLQNDLDLANAEAERVRAENIRIQNEADRALVDAVMDQKESEREDSELERIQNESKRATNEEVRKQNENTRQSNESIRMSNETDRKTQENRRVTAETNRVNSETTRRNNENSRISNEIERQKAMNEMKSLIDEANGFDERVGVVENKIEEINSSLDSITQQQADLFQSVSNGKMLLASAITDKGVTTLATDTFKNMADNILSISGSSSSGGGIENYTETPIYEYGYRVIFYDDFKTLNRNYWHEGYLSCWATQEQQVFGKPRYELNNGLKLMIKSANDTPWCSDYDGIIKASALMSGTRDGLHDFKGDGTTLKVRTPQQKYFGQITKCGKFEMVAKTPQTGGNMAAWWLVGLQDTETQNCEIDIFENVGNVQGQVMSSLHKWKDNTLTETNGFKYQTGVDLSADYHKYTLIWDEANLKFYFDDVLYLTCQSNISYPLMQIITCYEVQSGWWGGAYDSSALYPKTLDIKYIKISKKIPDGYNEVEKLSIVSQDEINFETGNPIIINGELKGLQSYCTLRFNDGTDEQFFVRWETLTENDLENKEEITLNGYIYNCSQNLLNGRKAIANIKFLTPLTGIELTLNTVDYIVGGTANISVKYIPSNTSQKGVNYSSSDTSIATVDTNGNVSFLKEGTVTLYATSSVDSSIVGSKTIYVDIGNEITYYPVYSSAVTPNSWFTNSTLTEGFSIVYNTYFFNDEVYVANNLSNNYNLPLAENSNYIKNTDAECYISQWGSIYYRLNKSRYEDVGIETYLANNPLEFKIDITNDETIVTKETIKFVDNSYFLSSGTSDGPYYNINTPCLNTFSEFSSLFNSTDSNNTILWVKNNSVPTNKPSTTATYIEIGVTGYVRLHIPISLLETVDSEGVGKYLQANPIKVCYMSKV